jgi:hypothetical protein
MYFSRDITRHFRVVPLADEYICRPLDSGKNPGTAGSFSI